MALPQITTRDEWLAARTALLEKEKALTRARDELNVERRRLPMVEITTDYTFTGADGEVGLVDLFEGRRQLIVYHFMFHPEWEAGCPSCTAGAVETSQGLLDHLHDRDTTLVYVSRAPYAKLAAYRAEQGYPVPHYSSAGTEFNVDFGVTFDPERAPVVYNYRAAEEWAEQEWNPFANPDDFPFDLHGHSVFLRHGDRVFHTYSMYGRGAETVGGSPYWLDLTALGRQEDWEQPKDRTERDLPPHPGVTADDTTRRDGGRP